MPFRVPFTRLSLRAKLITNYLVILGTGGLVTSVVGSWIVSTTIMAQARLAVDRDLRMARSLYDQQLTALERAVSLAVTGPRPRGTGLGGIDARSLSEWLETIRGENGFDFLVLADRSGTVLARAGAPEPVPAGGVVGAALAGTAAAATEAVDAGLAMIAAAPVRPEGVLYGGVVLNSNRTLVDRIWDVVFQGDRYEDREVGSVAIFRGPASISAHPGNARGAEAPREITDAVLGRGRTWRGRATVLADWYISAWEPLRDSSGRAVGMLSVGLLEKAYTSTRDRVILSFFAIASLGFVLIIAITYYEIRRITLPVANMVAATRSIAAGRFDQEVPAGAQGEIALLAESFNTMLKSLRQMKGDLQEWGRTLEVKVRERTEELVQMQARVAQSERLASLGLLAAGVAHEINNPLGGIFALTGLTLEDMAAADPNRENLEEVLRQTQRCRDIVRKLLDFARRTETQTEPVDLNEIIDETLGLLVKQAAFLNIRVIRQLDPAAPPVEANRSELQQVLINVAMNAAQAMAESGTLTILTRGDAGERMVEVSISDTGCGIPPEKIGQVFDPFFTTKASGQGTGLGLSIAYGIVTAHGGTISVASEVGKGSTFTVRIPAAVRQKSGAGRAEIGI